MILFETKNSLISTNRTRPEEIKVGKTYMVAGVIERGVYKGTLNTYFKEYLYRNNEIHLMTKLDGAKPFAVATNDCMRDGFDAFHLSKIYVDEGNYIVHGYKLPQDESYDPIRFNIFQVIIINPTHTYGVDMMEVKAVNICTSIDDELFGKFNPVIQHAMEVFDCDLEDQLIPKYCFNPNRYVSLRLFERNDTNEVESYFSSGQRLVLNANSKARFTETNEITSGGLYRVFYSKKFKNSSDIFVDGMQLSPLTKWDLEKYIKKSYLDETIAQDMIKKVITEKGNTFYAVTNLSGQIRPIYKSTNGYLSFSLCKQEQAFISELKSI
jgi:hypothetical protein